MPLLLKNLRNERISTSRQSQISSFLFNSKQSLRYLHFRKWFFFCTKKNHFVIQLGTGALRSKTGIVRYLSKNIAILGAQEAKTTRKPFNKVRTKKEFPVIVSDQRRRCPFGIPRTPTLITSASFQGSMFVQQGLSLTSSAFTITILNN